VVVTPTPLVGPDRRGKEDNHTNFGGFRSEGEAFLRWAADEGLPQRGLVVITGDRHWQYHSVHPSGVHELSVGALHDQNLQRGMRPGSFWSTDPDGLIEQPFLEDDTGGFLWVEVEREEVGSRLRATWMDEFGTPRNRWTPPPRP
jgi:alkaline phosphatase/alkaline phosphatase D